MRGAPATMQKRGADADDARKFRITVELRRLLRNYVPAAGAEGGAATPRGEMGRSCLVVRGVHCRLDNISLEKMQVPGSRGHMLSHVWLEDDTFTVAGNPVSRKAGEPVMNGIMEQ